MIIKYESKNTKMRSFGIIKDHLRSNKVKNGQNHYMTSLSHITDIFEPFTRTVFITADCMNMISTAVNLQPSGKNENSVNQSGLHNNRIGLMSRFYPMIFVSSLLDHSDEM